MERKGFTLIELLAVIVILAVIALIATPIVMNVIENSQKGAAERTAENYISAVETKAAALLINGEKIKGRYTIQEDGNLCPEEQECNDDIKINIDMSGTKPSGGTIVIKNGKVTRAAIMVVDKYVVSFDKSKDALVAQRLEKDEIAVIKVCSPVSEVTAGNYDYGDEYICDLGDGVDRRFFIIEDGDDTSLTKVSAGSPNQDGDNVGFTDLNEITLIMSENFDNETMLWCLTDNIIACNADGLEGKLNQIRDVWSNLSYKQINLPTYGQLSQVINNCPFAERTWLYNYLGDDINSDLPYGYWTSTGHNRIYANFIRKSVITYATVYKEHGIGVRPVITISKNQIG